MSLHKVSELNALPDPLKQYQFTFTISTMRGSSGLAGILSGGRHDSTSSSSDLEICCQGFNYPGSTIKTTEVVIGTHYRKRAALQDKSGTWRTTVIETQGGRVLTTIQNWMDAINNPVTGTIAPSELYVSLAELKILNNNNTVKRIYLRGVYPVSLAPIELDVNSSNPVHVVVDWNYDWYTEEYLLGL